MLTTATPLISLGTDSMECMYTYGEDCATGTVVYEHLIRNAYRGAVAEQGG